MIPLLLEVGSHSGTQDPAGRLLESVTVLGRPEDALGGQLKGVLPGMSMERASVRSHGAQRTEHSQSLRENKFNLQAELRACAGPSLDPSIPLCSQLTVVYRSAVVLMSVPKGSTTHKVKA